MTSAREYCSFELKADLGGLLADVSSADVLKTTINMKNTVPIDIPKVSFAVLDVHFINFPLLDVTRICGCRHCAHTLPFDRHSD